VIDVERVMAGVVVAFATVPARPLAETTLTLVTVPVPPVEAIVISPGTGLLSVIEIPDPAMRETAPVIPSMLDTPEEPPEEAGSLM
jgi:hypothetical protein